ncbi:MAG: hypothetical protein QOG21_2271 [Actinomycetota bacterium]|jgi:hypothetical protein|nr:hypothetical protein [Actinomycetota bacterium]
MTGSKDGLQIGQDLDFQRKEWRVQRIVWLFVVAILVAAVIGLIGPGPLSSTSAGPAGFRVHYLRFARWQAPQSLVVSVGSQRSGTLQLSFNRSFLDSMAVQQVTPQPAGVKVSATGFLFTFDATSGTVPADITFDLQPNSMGTLHGTISLSASGGRTSSVDISQLVYP